MSRTLTKMIEVEAEFDMSDLSDQELWDELAERDLPYPQELTYLVQRIYDAYGRRNITILEIALEDLFYDVLGRIAPAAPWKEAA